MSAEGWIGHWSPGMGGVSWNHWLELWSLWVLVAAVGWRLRST